MRWLADPSMHRLGVVVVLGAALLQPVRSGFNLCPFHAATGWPCPGCGMTRSLSALMHGQLDTALALHPFSLLLGPLFALLALLALAPEPWLKAVERSVDSNAWAISRAYRALAIAFVGFGLARLGVFIALRWSFP